MYAENKGKDRAGSDREVVVVVVIKPGYSRRPDKERQMRIVVMRLNVAS